MELSSIRPRQSRGKLDRSQIERRLKNSQPAGFLVVFVILLILQSVVVIMSGALSNLSSRRSLRREWDQVDQLELEAAAARSLLNSPDEVSITNPQHRHAPISRNLYTTDNYYSRQHMPSRDPGEPKPVLLVGGSDGSGTRAFVATLMQLGVPMLVDDNVGYDVHALTLFDGEGWPPLVSAVMNVTGTANYEYDSLPSSIKQLTETQVKMFHDQIELRGAAKLQAIRESGNLTTTKVGYGLKAPVTMLLLPILRQVFGPIKFIHVVRDGRDVAFSKNQSPVKKFYGSFFKDSESRRELYDNAYFKEVMAIELWNDWNVQAHDWGREHNDGSTFDYLVMRSEDMLDPHTRHQSLLQLANFVGSPKTSYEICCLSRQGLNDMGVSGRHGSDRSSQQLLSNPVADAIEQEHGEEWESAFKPMDQALGRRMKELEKLKDVAPHIYEQIHKMQASQELEMKARRKERLLQKFGARLRIEDVLLNQREDPSLQQVVHRKLLEEAKPANDVNDPEAPVDIGRRYGKWLDALKGKHELSKLLHRAGKEGLARFGYEPAAAFLDASNEPEFQCDQFVTCPATYQYLPKTSI